MASQIARVDVHVLKSRLDQSFAFSQGFVGQRSATLVEITTDDGLIGWGEAFAQGLEPPEIAAAAIAHAFAPMLIGESPLDTERLWFAMYNRSRDFGRKGSVMAAISAIDMALWDIAGKAYGQPVYQLMGGAFRHRVQPYATGFYRLKGQGEAARLAEEALRHWDNGFRAMKIKLGFGIQDDLEVMQAVRRALGAREVELMVDTNHAYGRAQACQLGRAMAEMNLRWYEEPVAPEDLEGYAELRRSQPIAIAGGENEHSLYGFRALLDANAIDIAQPDLGSCGGLTAARHITTLAQAKAVEVNPHVWGSAVSQAAALHYIASLPTTHHALFARQPILEYDQSDHPFRRQLTTTPIEIKDGWVDIPDRPGLGIEIERDVLAHFRA